MFQLKNIYKLLLFITVLLILIANVYAAFQPSINPPSDLTNSNSSDFVSQNPESSRRENSLVSDNKTKTCHACNDTGTIIKTIENYMTCPACAGAGKIPCHHCNGLGRLGIDICTICLGAGLQTCPDCGGKGYKSETVTTKEKCPACIVNKH